MPNTELTVRVGQSDNIYMQLLTDADNDGIAETPINLSAVDHMEFILINKDTGGTTIYNSTVTPKFGTAAVTNGATNGSVQFIPSGTEDLVLTAAGKTNQYEGYIWIYSTATKKFSVPETHEITIRVRP